MQKLVKVFMSVESNETRSDGVSVSLPESPGSGQDLAQLLDRSRNAGDPELDALVDQVRARGGRLYPSPEGPRDSEVDSFLAAHSALPDWADPKLIEQGQDLFFRYGTQIITLLFFHALPEGYACERPARLLAYTRQMSDHDAILKRILRTAQFLIDVMTPGSLEAGGVGIRSAVNLRLTHSIVRTRLRGQVFADDQPLINQEELAGTLGTFSALTLDGLEYFEIDLTDEEVRAYVHAWNVVGFLMGIDAELLCASRAGSADVFNSVRERIQIPCDESVELTLALRRFLREMIPLEVADGCVETLMRKLLSPKVAADLQIPEPDWTECFISAFRVFSSYADELGDRSVMIRWCFGKLHALMIDGLMAVYQPDEPAKPAIAISDELLSGWGAGARQSS